MTTVLVIDDEEAIRTNLSVFLQDEGFDVLAAANAEAALGMLQQRSVDVAIVDMRLPGMDGNAFIQAAHNICLRMKFLIHTGSSRYSLPAASRKLGIRTRHIFRKPVADMSLIAQAIRHLTDRNRLPQDKGD